MMADRQKRVRHILQTCRDGLTKPEPDCAPDIRCGLNYMNTCLFDHDCHVSEMKNRCRIRDHNFTLRFRNYTGRTPRDYLTHHRIEAAKHLLADEELKELPVSDIAYAVGYERVATFTTLFTKNVGLPPGVWRKQRIKKQLSAAAEMNLSKKISKKK